MQADRPISIAVILFASLMIAFFLVTPEYNKFKNLRADLGQKMAEFKAQHDYYASVDRAYFDLQSRKDDVSKIDDALSQNPAIGQLVYALQKYAGDSGMIVKNLSLSKASSNSDKQLSSKVKDIVFSMDLSGSYSALGNFISTLERSAKIFEVINISFSSSASSSLGNFNVQIKTYSY